MEQYLQLLKQSVIEHHPEIGNIEQLQHIGAYDMTKYTADDIQTFLGGFYIDSSKQTLHFERSLMSRNHAEKEAVLYLVNRRYLALFFEDENLFSDPALVRFIEVPVR
jgi:hypothetical protein